MMKGYLATLVVLLEVFSKREILCNKNISLYLDKFTSYSNESGVEYTNLHENLTSNLPKTEIPWDINVIPTTYRSARSNGSSTSAQERDTKLMSLLAARRSALHRERFKTHGRIVTTSKTRSPIETTSRAPNDLRTICVRNCTKNFTRRTTARCMRKCTTMPRKSNTTSTTNFTSEEEKSQRDNNEILFTDESSHGFFVVAKDENGTMNHIADLKKGIDHKGRGRAKPNTSMQVAETDSYLFFGRKIPSLRPSFLSISTVSDEHPQVLEVSVSQKPLRPKSSLKFMPRDRANAAFRRKLSTGKLTLFEGGVTSSVTGDMSKENDKIYGVSAEKSLNETMTTKLPLAEENVQLAAKLTLPERGLTSADDLTPSLLVAEEQISTEIISQDLSTPLIINVLDEEETTVGPESTYYTEATEISNENLSTEITKLDTVSPNISDDKTNLIIFVNKSMEGISSHYINSKENTNASEGITVVKTIILSSVRSTVYPLVNTGRPTVAPSNIIEDLSNYPPEESLNTEKNEIPYEPPSNTMPSLSSTSDRAAEESDLSDARRMNLATYVLAGLGMFPVLIVILYLAKSLILRGYSKHDEDFDVCITDQQPITPVKKIEKHHEEEESGQYEKCSITSLDEFNRANLRLKSLLGEGNFGQVWKAEADDLSGHIGATRIVAVKTVRSGSSQDSLREEASIMRKLGSHPNVVTLLGACVESEPHILIMEFAMRGRLLSLLRAARSATNLLPASVPGGKSLAPLSPRTLAGFALDIATGMEYVANKRIVHRDLAARNVLIDHNGFCKICDFGMSINLDAIRKKRDKQCTVGIMRKNSNKLDKFKFDIGERFINHWNIGFRNPNVNKPRDTLGRRPALPIRWMAPESLQFNEFSTETDVWAFGIVLWEIATLGATPYANLSGREVVHHVLQGIRPEFPKDGRHGFFDLMSQCWHKIPDLRPTFREARLEVSKFVCKWMDDNVTTSDYMDVSGFSEDLEHGMLYFNQRISEFECEI